MAPSLELGPKGFPLVQGIELVSTHELPDRMRSVFKHQVFNAIQSKCFNTVFRSDDNFVLSAPTGSGKTTIMELAICRLVTGSRSNGGVKVVYQAPTKALCAERQVDWAIRFGHLGLKCAELTGDTDQKELRAVQSAEIIVTTPEKWDSMTRKWRDHAKLMELVKLFLIDEVHILKEDRGAILETVVSRMKSVGSNVRFVALSATVPNSDDIATWLGRNYYLQHLPACREVFGEEFRPVKLQKYVVGLQGNSGNDWVFEKLCNHRLPDVISKYGTGKKPIMIFCFTRKSTEDTASLLSQWWASSTPSDQYWNGPKKQVAVGNETLRRCITSGVAFHHAGIELPDRNAVERAYLDGDINVICSTSTLAVGVNLPCHFVIVKNTVSYQTEGLKEYSDLEMMQMLGRAGRPQFDQSAIAVILTRAEKVARYESMVSGQQILESRLHENLIDHLNSEIGLNTINNRDTARSWLKSTFFFTRLQKNPDHYRLKGMLENQSFDDVVDSLCNRDLKELHECSLIAGDESRFKSTELGDAMARYYIHFNTMKLFLSLQSKPKISELLSVLAQAAEYKSIYFRAKEKAMYKEINTSPSIRFPIKVDLALPGHKISLIIQAVLGGLDTRNDNRFADNHMQFQSDCTLIFRHIHRLIRCIIDCQLYLGDSVGARNALELARALGARAWDDSPLQLQQIEKIGPVSVRKLVSAGIKTMEDLENTDAQRIDMILSKNPPFGAKVLEQVKTFPKLRVLLKMMGPYILKTTTQGKCLRVNIKADIGFINDKVPVLFMKKAVHLILLAETSDGRKVHFHRASAQKIGSGQEVTFAADLTNPQQIINCYVSCDDIAGTLKYASLNPKIAASAFPVDLGPDEPHHPKSKTVPFRRTSSKRQAPDAEEFEDADIEDSDLVAAEDGFANIDDLEAIDNGRKASSNKNTRLGSYPDSDINATWRPTKLQSGKWACNHKCKDKMKCKHMCCREGVDKPPKPPRAQIKEVEAAANVKKPVKQSGATDFFKQTKPTAATATSKVESKTNLNINVPQYNSPSNGSQTLFGDESPTFGDYDEGVATTNALLASTNNAKRGRGLFLTSSSSPQKIAELDLTGIEPATKRGRYDQDAAFPQYGVIQNAQALTSERRRIPELTESGSLPKCVTLRDLERNVTSGTSFGGTLNVSNSVNDTSFNAEAEAVLTAQQTNDFYDDLDLKLEDVVDETYTMSGALQTAGILADSEPPYNTSTTYGYSTDLNETLPGITAAASSSLSSTEHSMGQASFDVSANEALLLNEMANTGGETESQMQEKIPEGVDPWLVEYFGDYVEFV